MNPRDMKKPSQDEYWISLAQNIAAVSCVFSFIVAAFLVFNYISAVRGLPEKELLFSQRMAGQKALLAQNPKDETVIREVRRLDWELRRTYFSRMFFSARGKYFLLGSAVIGLVSLQIAAALRKPPRKPKHSIDSTVEKKLRKQTGAAVGLTGGILLCVVFVLAPAPQYDLSSQTSAPDGAATGISTPQPDYAGWEEMQKNWPTFRGPGGLGISAYTTVPISWNEATGEGILWKAPVPLPGNNSPIVWGDRIFLTGGDSARKEVYCFSLKTGEILWKDRVEEPPAAAGEELEVFEGNGWATPTMACDGLRVYAIFANGMAAGYDLSGKRLWTKHFGIPESIYGFASSLTVYRDLLLIQFDQAQVKDNKSVLYALRGKTGEVAWQVPRPVANSWTSPIVAEAGQNAQIITVSEPWVIAYNPATGEELWKADLMGMDLAPSAIFANGTAYVIQPGKSMFAIRADGKGDVTKTHVAWTADCYAPDVCSPVSNGELVFLLATSGVMTCLDAKSGELIWEEEVDDSFMASPTLAGEWLYLFGEKGTMHRIKASRVFEASGTASLDGQILASPAFLDGRIIVRSDSNLYCLGNK